MADNNTSITISCIYDPGRLYCILAIVDCIAYCIPCVSQRTHLRVRGFLFAANLALVVNLLFIVYIDPAYYVSYFFVVVALFAFVLLYSYAASLSLLIVLIFTVGATFFTLQSFVTEWTDKVLDVQLSYTQLSVLFLFGTLLSSVVLWGFSRLHVVTIVIDSFVYSLLVVFAMNFFLFLENQANGWEVEIAEGNNSTAWVNITYDSMGSSSFTQLHTTLGFVPSNGELCCDDVYVPCPFWLYAYQLVVWLFLFIARLALSSLNYGEIVMEQRRRRQREAAASSSSNHERRPLLNERIVAAVVNS